jgi:hypothetical protein
VIFSSSADRKFKGSVAPVTAPAAHPKGTVNLNSGFIIAYAFSYVTDAIKKNPIGAPLTAK